MKIIAGIVAGILLTIAFYEIRPKKIPEEARTEFAKFTLSEAKKYAEATDPGDKLRAAEELYGKMVVLFLANLGLELKKSAPVSAATGVDPEKAGSLAQAAAVIPVRECAPCASVMTEPKKKEELKKLTAQENLLRSPYMNKFNPVIRKMIGAFAGKLTYFAGRRNKEVDGASIEVDLVERDGRLSGMISVILTDGLGKIYSHNRDRGGNKTIRYNEKDKIVYVEASPDSFFAFRAREFDRGEVTGEYYEDNAMVGRAVLFRQ